MNGVAKEDAVLSDLEHRQEVVGHLQMARRALSGAHAAASERDGERRGLNGPVRDLIFGLNTAVDSLSQMIEEGRFGTEDQPDGVSAGSLDTDGD